MIMPTEIEEDPRARVVREEAVEASRDAYSRILDILRKAPMPTEYSTKEFLRSIRSAARSLLPNATETKIVVTVNARALRHFLVVRGSIPGDHEMRCFADELLAHAKKDAPALFSDFARQELSDGSPIIQKLESPIQAVAT